MFENKTNNKIEDCENTIYNLKINKIYDEEKEFKESYIQRYLDVFFIELFGENKEKITKYNFNKQKFKQYFNWDVVYNSSNKISYSKIEIEQKEQEIRELKDKLDLCEKETEKLKQQNLELQEKIDEYEKQLEISNRFKESLKEYLK